jgi:Zn-dependent protease with chaperone function
MANRLTDFSSSEIARARDYHRPIYATFGVGVALGLYVRAALAFGWPGDRLFALLDGLPWWGATLAFAALTLVCVAVVRLPLSFWRGYLHERRFGFSTQGLLGWLTDWAKAVALGIVITALAVLGLVGLARALPGAWPAVAAPAAALLTVLLSYVAPVLLEPVFNRFRPVEDGDLAVELRALADRAGVPIRDVLVTDASRRTRKENAYVSGLGRTRRIVLYDTLLSRASRRELRLVTAHELAHRRAHHVAKGTLLGAVGAAAGVLVLWGLLSWPSLLGAIGATGAGDPRVVPFVFLTGALLELVCLPFVSELSRSWERVADRGSLELTGDLQGFETTQLSLARANLSDLDPPRAVYRILFSHPTPPERLADGRRFAETDVRIR